jgi:hypothetical protein
MQEDKILKIDEEKLLESKKVDRKKDNDEITTEEEPFPYLDAIGKF